MIVNFSDFTANLCLVTDTMAAPIKLLTVFVTDIVTDFMAAPENLCLVTDTMAAPIKLLTVFVTDTVTDSTRNTAM